MTVTLNSMRSFEIEKQLILHHFFVLKLRISLRVKTNIKIMLGVQNVYAVDIQSKPVRG